jgi:hypothetical protein
MLKSIFHTNLSILRGNSCSLCPQRGRLRERSNRGSASQIRVFVRDFVSFKKVFSGFQIPPPPVGGKVSLNRPHDSDVKHFCTPFSSDETLLPESEHCLMSGLSQVASFVLKEEEKPKMIRIDEGQLYESVSSACVVKSHDVGKLPLPDFRSLAI